jgi:hypothetical protein
LLISPSAVCLSPGRIDIAEMRPDRMKRRMGLILGFPELLLYWAPAPLRFKASIKLMTLGGSAIARGAVASPFVFASTNSRSAS